MCSQGQNDIFMHDLKDLVFKHAVDKILLSHTAKERKKLLTAGKD